MGDSIITLYGYLAGMNLMSAWLWRRNVRRARWALCMCLFASAFAAMQVLDLAPGVSPVAEVLAPFMLGVIPGVLTAGMASIVAYVRRRLFTYEHDRILRDERGPQARIDGPRDAKALVERVRFVFARRFDDGSFELVAAVACLGLAVFVYGFDAVLEPVPIVLGAVLICVSWLVPTALRTYVLGRFAWLGTDAARPLPRALAVGIYVGLGALLAAAYALGGSLGLRVGEGTLLAAPAVVAAVRFGRNRFAILGAYLFVLPTLASSVAVRLGSGAFVWGAGGVAVGLAVSGGYASLMTRRRAEERFRREVVLERLRSGEKSERVWAASVFAVMSDHRVVGDLVRAAVEPDDALSYAAQAALRELWGPSPEQRFALKKRTAEREKVAVDDAVLRAEAEHESWEHLNAAETSVRSALSSERELMASLVTMMRGKWPVGWQVAGNLLAAQRSSEAYELLAEALRSGSPGVRMAAMNAYWHAGPDACTSLAELARDDRHIVRKLALASLRKVFQRAEWQGDLDDGDLDAGRLAFVEAAAHESAPTRFCALALAPERDQACRLALAALGDPAFGVRGMALGVLARFEPSIGRAAAERMVTDPRLFVRRAAGDLLTALRRAEEAA